MIWKVWVLLRVSTLSVMLLVCVTACTSEGNGPSAVHPPIRSASMSRTEEADRSPTTATTIRSGRKIRRCHSLRARAFSRLTVLGAP